MGTEATIKPKLKIKAFWKEYQWQIILLLSLLSFVMGILGFIQDEQQLLLDAAFKSLQLFTLNIEVERPQSLWLQISRFSSPFLAAFAFFQALMSMLRSQLIQGRISRLQNHVVICGFGDKGLLLAKAYRRLGYPVVVVEREAVNPNLAVCEEIGAYAVLGDAAEPDILNKVGAGRARYLFAVCGGDGINADIGLKARELCRTRRHGCLTCVIHIIDLDLWTLLREKEFSKEILPGFNLEFFNVYDSGARLLMREIRQSFNGTAGLFLVGFNHFSEALILQAARTWAADLNRPIEKLDIYLSDPQSEERVEILKKRVPLLNTAAELDALPTHPLDLEQALLTSAGRYDSAYVIICQENITAGVGMGLRLSRLLRPHGARVVVQAYSQSGLSSLVGEPGEGGLSAFGLLERTCGPGQMDDGTHEAVGRAIHADYLRKELDKPVEQRSASAVAWEELPDEIRQSNLREADHIGVKLAAVHCGITPWVDECARQFAFTGAEIEIMAEMEHERWRAERISQGYRYAEKRDERRKLHPGLLSWNDPKLDESNREYTRKAVKKIPAYLLTAGFQIFRLPNHP